MIIDLDSLSIFLPALVTFPALALAEQYYTIDDTHGDPSNGIMPVYTPADLWISRGTEHPCSGCGVQPDASQTLLNTWHEITNNVGQDPGTVTFNFTGIALSVFCILPGTLQRADMTTETHLAFFIDHQQVDTFNFVPNTTALQYKQLVFSTDSLADQQHNFRMDNIADAKLSQMGSIAMFDYALYTRSTDPPVTGPPNSTVPTSVSSSGSPGQSSPPGETPGAGVTSQRTPVPAPSAGQGERIRIGIAATAAVIILGAIAFLLLRLRRRRRSRREMTMFYPIAAEPFPSMRKRRPLSTLPSDSTQLYEEIAILRDEVDRLRVIANEVPPPTYHSRTSRISTD